MNWPGAVQKTGTFSRLEQYKNDIRPVVLYTHTFVLINKEGRADERHDRFFTATGTTPEEAATAAEMVYLRSTACSHHFMRKNPTLMECRNCGIQQRVVPGQPLPGSNKDSAVKDSAIKESAVKETERKAAKGGGLFGLFRKS